VRGSHKIFFVIAAPSYKKGVVGTFVDVPSSLTVITPTAFVRYGLIVRAKRRDRADSRKNRPSMRNDRGVFGTDE
jgi:hypothetical protein